MRDTSGKMQRKGLKIEANHTMEKETAESKTHERDLGLRCFCSKRECWLVTCAQHVERNQEPKITFGDVRSNSGWLSEERSMTKRDEEELST